MEDRLKDCKVKAILEVVKFRVKKGSVVCNWVVVHNEIYQMYVRIQIYYSVVLDDF